MIAKVARWACGISFVSLGVSMFTMIIACTVQGSYDSVPLWAETFTALSFAASMLTFPLMLVCDELFDR